jgi:hypothetical protein
MKRKPLLSLGKVGLHILLPLTFALIPTSWIEARRPVCLVRNLFGVRCPGCGMTRALSCMAHGRPRRAFEHNKLIVVAVPVLAHAWARSLLTEYWRYRWLMGDR